MYVIIKKNNKGGIYMLLFYVLKMFTSSTRIMIFDGDFPIFVGTVDVSLDNDNVCKLLYRDVFKMDYVFGKERIDIYLSVIGG